MIIAHPPAFCRIDINGGQFWSRPSMVRDGIEKFRIYKATCISQGMTEDQFAVVPFIAVMNSQACTMFNVAPAGRA